MCYWSVASIPMEQGGTCRPIFTVGETSISMPPPMFEDFNLETACFSIQLIANAWIFSARNLPMSRSVLFSEQPASQPRPKLDFKCTWLRGSYRRIGDESIWAQPQDHCSHCIWSNECVWSTLGQVNPKTLCVAAATLQSPQFLETVWHNPTTSVVYALVVMGNNLVKVT